MSGLKDIAKGGWHPKGKDGKKSESWRGDFKGINQVAGWMGKGKDSSQASREHVSQPLSALKDPSAFGPPPKNVNYRSGAAIPNQITPDAQGLGAPLSKDEINARRQAEVEEAQREAEEAAKPKPPPVPYRADKTGLSTSHLPSPPVRKDGADGRIPTDSSKPKPPPRLPPRNELSLASSPPPNSIPATTELDPHKGILNQGSLSRLSAAGVSVPGFGIGGTKPKPTLSPPASLSPTRSPATTSSHVNSPQLNELQSRFSRLSSPKTESPGQGTTFAQKQAALKTVSSFQKDPSSVSFSDAKSAASTANNFRERHGEQVKSGWQSANSLNSKYGISDKVGRFGGIAPQTESSSPQVDVSDHSNSANTSNRADLSMVGKKKPPPPPVKRAELGGILKEAAPPPIPLSSKPKPQVSGSHYSTEARDFDLDLKSEWYAKSPPAFPPKSMKVDGKITHAISMGWSGNGTRKIHTFTAHIRFLDTLASAKIHLTWDASNPAVTVKAQQKHYPPPRKLQSSELEAYGQKYSGDVARWCESRMGSQVGDGECWTLANEALKAVAAKCSSRGQEPCMSSQSYIHGYLLYSYNPTQSQYPSPRGGIMEGGVARGDIIQMKRAHFMSSNGSQKWAGDPDHTAVITHVEANGVLGVLEQNVGSSKRVQTGSYNMVELVNGDVRIFRAVGESWVGTLNPKW